MQTRPPGRQPPPEDGTASAGPPRQKKKKGPKRLLVKLGKLEFEILDHYHPTEVLGQGAYATVCAAVDARTGDKRAIKKNKGIFDRLSDAKRILREIKLLACFDSPDVTNLAHVIPPRPEKKDTFVDVYLVMCRMDADLARVIKSKVPLAPHDIKLIIYQMLRGLKYIHSMGVVHRDMKPENILINVRTRDIKLADFGLARGVCKDEGEENALTEYVVTRWYRAPEVICCARQYDERVDVWSVGCIFAELIRRKPLFPGRDYMDQLRIIFKTIGKPVEAKLDWISHKDAKKWVARQKPSPGIDFRAEFPESKLSDDGLDLMKRLLVINPQNRISVDEAIEHPFLADVREPEKEITAPTFDLSFEFEATMKTKFGIRHLMYHTLIDFYNKREDEQSHLPYESFSVASKRKAMRRQKQKEEERLARSRRGSDTE